jgi:hypothetical protein
MAMHNLRRGQSCASLRAHEPRIIGSFVLIAAAVGLAGCAARSADQNPVLRGVGTPGVSLYPADNQATTLHDLLDHCRQVAPAQAGPPSGTRDLSAACRQLRRTLHNQPGNTVEPGAPP